MWDDGYSGAHSLSFNVQTKSEISSNAFDIITSKKGAAIIRMVESILGSGAIQDGFRVNIVFLVPIRLFSHNFIKY